MPRAGDFRNTRKWRDLSKRVLREELYVCHWCGDRATQTDHVIPCGAPHYGPKWERSNLVASCGPCNNGRNNPEWVAPRDRRVGFSMDGRKQHSALANLHTPKRGPRLTGDYSRPRGNRGAA